LSANKLIARDERGRSSAEGHEEIRASGHYIGELPVVISAELLTLGNYCIVEGGMALNEGYYSC
jgi:hypothetical protein